MYELGIGSLRHSTLWLWPADAEAYSLNAIDWAMNRGKRTLQKQNRRNVLATLLLSRSASQNHQYAGVVVWLTSRYLYRVAEQLLYHS